MVRYLCIKSYNSIEQGEIFESYKPGHSKLKSQQNKGHTIFESTAEQKSQNFRKL